MSQHGRPSPRAASPSSPLAAPRIDPAATSAAPEPPRSEAVEPPFEPLFTLLTNSTTNTTVHPRVHYVFSDDDPGALASAAADPSHRAIVVDLAPAPQHTPPDQAAEGAASRDGEAWRVASASSLSPDFAVTGSQLAVQQHGAEGGGALMLRVEGIEREPVDVGPSDASGGTGGSSGSLRRSGSGAGGPEDVDALLDEFHRRMGLMRRVVGEGERRREALDARADESRDDPDGPQQQPPPSEEAGGKAHLEDDSKPDDKA